MLFKQNAQNSQQGKPTPTAATDKVSPAKPLMSTPTPPTATATPRPVATASDSTDAGKRLIVGEGIQMKGEITACDRLVVEGQVEVTLKATRMLEIKPSGHFTGSCEVEEAEVSGVYDGNLTVRGRLTVHAGGRVTGDINYGEIELERGRPDHGQARCPRSGLAWLDRAGRRPPERRLARCVRQGGCRSPATHPPLVTRGSTASAACGEYPPAGRGPRSASVLAA
jgi:cytoskeletal protein CcmA (bactofilin family)